MDACQNCGSSQIIKYMDGGIKCNTCQWQKLPEAEKPVSVVEEEKPSVKNVKPRIDK